MLAGTVNVRVGARATQSVMKSVRGTLIIAGKGKGLEDLGPLRSGPERRDGGGERGGCWDAPRETGGEKEDE